VDYSQRAAVTRVRCLVANELRQARVSDGRVKYLSPNGIPAGIQR
jgi:hypothetical protein